MRRYDECMLPDNIKFGSVAELVASQAAATPDAVALTSATGVLSYKELDERASALADVLRALGVGPDVVVGLCAPRSPAMVVGALGILKAGGAYLPLDPTYPAARLAFVLDDGPVPVVVTAQCVKDQVPTGAHQTILLDDLGRVVHSPPLPRSARTKVAATLKNLAYVIYTSGSTGQPKGVEITHESLLNLVHWHQHAFRVTSADRASQVAKVGFDAAVWEIWPYLASGASLHMPDDEMVSDPESLRDWLVAQGITISFIPTPMAERLLTLPWPSGIALRTMLTGADTLHVLPAGRTPISVGQQLRSDGMRRGDHIGSGLSERLNGSTAADWSRNRQHTALHFGRIGQASVHGDNRRTPRRRSRGGTRLSEPAGVDGKEVHSESVRRQTR